MKVCKPIITAKEIRGMKPGETIFLHDVTEKNKSSVYTMVGYVKDMGLPRFIGGYTCTYNAAKRICSVTAIPKGENRRAYFRRANEMVRDMIADEK